MQSIWKFPLGLIDKAVVTMPVSAEVLCVQVQKGIPCIWALVRSTEEAKSDRVFSTFGTGHQRNEIGGRYVGTYQLEGGSLVFHVFEADGYRHLANNNVKA